MNVHSGHSIEPGALHPKGKGIEALQSAQIHCLVDGFAYCLMLSVEIMKNQESRWGSLGV